MSTIFFANIVVASFSLKSFVRRAASTGRRRATRNNSVQFIIITLLVDYCMIAGVIDMIGVFVG